MLELHLTCITSFIGCIVDRPGWCNRSQPLQMHDTICCTADAVHCFAIGLENIITDSHLKLEKRLEQLITSIKLAKSRALR